MGKWFGEVAVYTIIVQELSVSCKDEHFKKEKLNFLEDEQMFMHYQKKISFLGFFYSESCCFAVMLDFHNIFF